MRYENGFVKCWRLFVVVLCGCFIAVQAAAEISLTDHNAMLRQQRWQAHHRGINPLATGSEALVDASGVKYFINDNITFSTSSSGSAAMSEASYTHAVAASTSGGGTVASTLNDAFDGYGQLCVSFDGATGPCETGNAHYVNYLKNGSATSECLGATSGVNRQWVFNQQTMGTVPTPSLLHVYRKVFVPDNDSFARWLNYFTNVSASPVTFNAIWGNNLGSDANTKIVATSTGSTTSPFTDTTATWVSTFQDYSGTTSSDPRLGHVLQGVDVRAPLTAINFADGDDNPWWAYTLTLQPGETQIIMTFVAVQPSKAAANAKAAALTMLPPNTLQCMSAQERPEVVNFQAEATMVPSLSRTGLVVLVLLLTLAGFLVLRTRMA